MFVPPKLRMSEWEDIHDFIEKFNFGVLISSDLTATHLPFALDREEGEFGTLTGHFARANFQWKDLDGKKVLIVFSGPHAYISPTWYASVPNVPTWNYAAVHIHGIVSLTDKAETLKNLEQMLLRHEPALCENRDIVTDEYRDKLLGALVGLKIRIVRADGKLKLGQNRDAEDQKGVYRALSESEFPGDNMLADYMREKELGTGIRKP